MANKDNNDTKCICPYCDAELDEDSALCAACQVRIIHCENCGKPVATTMGVCPTCGEKIE